MKPRKLDHLESPKKPGAAEPRSTFAPIFFIAPVILVAAFGYFIRATIHGEEWPWEVVIWSCSLIFVFDWWFDYQLFLALKAFWADHRGK